MLFRCLSRHDFAANTLLAQSGISEIDTVLESMTCDNPETRPDAFGALEALLTAIAEIPPKELRGAPTILMRDA